MSNSNESNPPIEDQTSLNAEEQNASASPLEEIAVETEETTSLENKIEKLEAQLKEEKDRALRTQAEMVNFRKRQEKERGVWNQMAIKDVISSILEPLDNLERTIQAATLTQADEEVNPKLTSLAEGLSMVMEQFSQIFQRKNIVCLDPKGESFDPNEHEAYGQIETDEFDEGKVAIVFRKGYKIGDTLIRTATVQVAKKPSPDNEQSED